MGTSNVDDYVATCSIDGSVVNKLCQLFCCNILDRWFLLASKLMINNPQFT